LKPVAGQSEPHALRGACIQEMEEDALAFFNPNRLAMAETLAIDRKVPVC
jgi:hypothetical protein